ncbi:MAG: HD domain-containing protein [Chloroflexi bacterium]|nr:HD domain-containing protein [Chloroflexota bacterium]
MADRKDRDQRASPYAGRWVARLQANVVAHGGTPDQTRLAAQKSRHKEKPEVIYMPLTSSFILSPLIERVRAALPDQEIYLVGGAVRDALLGRVSHDFDFAVPKDAISLARRVASALEADFYVLDESFDAARVIVSAQDGVRDFLDFASFRGADPSTASGRSLEADLRGRDFTINAIAFDLHNATILDPLNGAADLRAKIIRACSESSFKDDPIRILRAVRQAAAFEFRIEAETRKAMKRAVSLLPNISPERQRDELFKMLEGPRPDASLRALELLGVFPFLLPELSAMRGVEQSAPHVNDVWEHTLSVIQHLEGILVALAPNYEADKTNEMFTGLLTLRLGRYRKQLAEHFANPLNTDRSLRALLFFAALYHDVSKPAAKSVDEAGRIRFFDHEVRGASVAAERARSFNLSNAEIERLEIVIANHMRFHFFVNRMESEKEAPSRKAIYRFFRDAGEGGVDLILLGLADLRGTHIHTLTQAAWTAALNVARTFLENYWERPEETVAPPRLIDGNDIMREYNLEQGPVIGQVLEAVREAQAVGKVSTREQALAFGLAWLKENRK